MVVQDGDISLSLSCNQLRATDAVGSIHMNILSDKLPKPTRLCILFYTSFSNLALLLGSYQTVCFSTTIFEHSPYTSVCYTLHPMY